MKNMKKILFIAAATLVWLTACDTDQEAKNLLVPYQYSEDYYANLRAYKQTDHQICFGWYAAYSAEGSPSAGAHFQGLPDSMDIISLWSPIPCLDPEYTAGDSEFSERYLPIAYKEMWEMRNLKGTRLVKAIICRIAYTDFPRTDAGIEAYALHLVEMVNRNNLDGLDLDYEPEGDWLSGDNFTKFVKVIGQHLGPKSGTGKILIVDFYNTTPPAACEPYVNYFIRQCYTTSSSSSLNSSFSGISSWCPPGKFVPTEQMGWYWENGGVKFTETGNSAGVDSWGNPLYSVVGMARWNPSSGKKAGFGGFYFEYEYNTQRPAKQSIGDVESEAIPYFSMRRGIQEQNPAVTK